MSPESKFISKYRFWRPYWIYANELFIQLDFNVCYLLPCVHHPILEIKITQICHLRAKLYQNIDFGGHIGFMQRNFSSNQISMYAMRFLVSRNPILEFKILQKCHLKAKIWKIIDFGGRIGFMQMNFSSYQISMYAK